MQLVLILVLMMKLLLEERDHLVVLALAGPLYCNSIWGDRSWLRGWVRTLGGKLMLIFAWNAMLDFSFLKRLLINV